MAKSLAYALAGSIAAAGHYLTPAPVTWAASDQSLPSYVNTSPADESIFLDCGLSLEIIYAHDASRTYAEPAMEAAEWQLLEQIDGFSRLPNNWDSFGAGSISSQAISLAKQFIKELSPRIELPEDVSATPDGSILMEFNSEERCILVEFFGNGKIGALVKGKEDRIPHISNLSELFELFGDSSAVCA